MTKNIYPITIMDRLVSSALMLITPEYKIIRDARRKSKLTTGTGPANFLINPENTLIDGNKIRFACDGIKGKPTLLLLNPLPQSILCYEQIWPLLAQHFELYAYDLPGFGGSEGGAEVMNTETQSRMLAEFVNQMNISDFHLVGPDIGMPVALHYALRSDCRATSLLIGDGPCVLPTLNGSIIDRMVNSALWRIIFRIGGAGTFVAGANRLCYTNYTPCPEELADYVASYKGRIGSVMEWFRAYPEIIDSIQPKLSEIEIPIQIFWGDLDQLLLVETGNKIHELLPKSKLTIFENCGHFSYQDRSNEFAAMITDWVNRGHLNL
jgi:pimeloyl-ACP methyl ester carboxylesterase